MPVVKETVLFQATCRKHVSLSTYQSFAICGYPKIKDAFAMPKIEFVAKEDLIIRMTKRFIKSLYFYD